MAYYGFTPQMKQTGSGIALAGQAIGQAVQQFPEAKRKQETYEYDKKQREDAIAELKKDWKKAGQTWKTFKVMYEKRAKAIGMAQNQIDSNLMDFPMPKESDKKDIGGYFDRLAQVQGTKNRDLTEKETGRGVEQGVREAMTDKPGQILPGQSIRPEAGPTPAPGEEQRGPEGGLALPKRTVPEFGQKGVGMSGPALAGQPGAVTQSEIAGSEEIPGGTTTEQLEQVPAYSTAQTQAEIDKQRLAQQKAETDAQKVKRKEEMTDLERQLKEAQIAASKATTAKKYADMENAEKRIKLTEDALKKVYDLEAGDYAAKVTLINKAIKAAENPQPEYDGGDVPDVNEAELSALHAQKIELERLKQEMINKAKTVGQMPSEKRKFGGEGHKKEISRTFGHKAPPAQTGIPGTKQRRPLGSFLKEE